MTRIKWFYRDYLEKQKWFFSILQYSYLIKIYSATDKGEPCELKAKKELKIKEINNVEM